MWGKVSIKSRVMAQINTLVNAAQKAYEDEIDAIEREAEMKKIEAADNHVKSILSKFM